MTWDLPVRRGNSRLCRAKSERPVRTPYLFWFRSVSAFGLLVAHGVYQQFTYVIRIILPAPA
ncbi:hypothetical protein DENIS_0321 [Desulfonema ishimotonii]|uniref:MFS transporter n=1 Tax=Desulfonema ishimotonii TaxID=45657 RepID=A0A401FQZ1_9BACT|nr:hypothetical protein DENIS_0321 [Desulfonema ishimotonii]